MGQAEGMSCAGGPPAPRLPLQGCCPHASQSRTEAQTGCAAHEAPSLPLCLTERSRLGKGAPWTPGFQNANLLQRLWEGPWLAPPLGGVEVSRWGSSPTPFSARAPLPGHTPLQGVPGSWCWNPRLRRTAGLGGPHVPSQGPEEPAGRLPGTWRESPTSPHSTPGLLGFTGAASA